MCKLIIKDKMTGEEFVSNKIKSEQYANEAKAILERYINNVKVEVFVETKEPKSKKPRKKKENKVL